MESGTLLPSFHQSTCDLWRPNARPVSLQQTVKEQREQREPGDHFRKSRPALTWNWFQMLWDRLQQGTQIWPSTPTTQPRLEYFHFCWLRKLKACHAHKHKQMVHLITSLAVRCTMGNHVAFFRIQFNYKEMENTLLLPGRQRQIRSIRKSSAEDRWRKHIREAYLSECDWKNNSYLNYKKKRGQKWGQIWRGNGLSKVGSDEKMDGECRIEERGGWRHPEEGRDERERESHRSFQSCARGGAVNRPSWGLRGGLWRILGACVCKSFVSCAHAQNMASGSLQAAALLPHHSTKQNKFCLGNSRMWTPSSALHSPSPALHTKDLGTAEQAGRVHKAELRLAYIVLQRAHVNTGLDCHDFHNTEPSRCVIPQSLWASAGPCEAYISRSFTRMWESGRKTK